MGGGSLALFSLHRKWMYGWAFLTRKVVLRVQERSSVMCTPRNLELLTLSTVVPFMCSGKWSAWILLKSTIITLVLSTLRDRLLSLQHSARPTTVVSSANLMM